MVKHKHDWQFAGIHWHSNKPFNGWTEWACECGAVKLVNILTVKDGV